MENFSSTNVSANMKHFHIIVMTNSLKPLTGKTRLHRQYGGPRQVWLVRFMGHQSPRLTSHLREQQHWMMIPERVICAKLRLKTHLQQHLMNISAQYSNWNSSPTHLRERGCRSTLKRPTQQEPRVKATAVSTRTGRVRKLSRRFRESIQQGQIKYWGYTAQYYEALHEEAFKLQDDMAEPIGFKASSDPDTMYYHQAMRAPHKCWIE